MINFAHMSFWRVSKFRHQIIWVDVLGGPDSSIDRIFARFIVFKEIKNSLFHTSCLTSDILPISTYSSKLDTFTCLILLSLVHCCVTIIHIHTILIIFCYCPACRTTLIATRFRVAVICPIIQVPHCIRVFFYLV